MHGRVKIVRNEDLRRNDARRNRENARHLQEHGESGLGCCHGVLAARVESLRVTPSQFAQISKFFIEASRLPPDQRDSYLHRACADEGIRHQVQLMLAQPRRLMGIDPSITGRTIEHYRIIEPIGSGSMGHVYKAHDLHLGRFASPQIRAVRCPERSELPRSTNPRGQVRVGAKSSQHSNHPRHRL